MAAMLHLDHLTVIAPSLAEGVEHVRDCLGLAMPAGGRHPEMGTRNHVLRLGDDVYLEVIAVDPEAPPPVGPRWFGLGDDALVREDWMAGRRLRGWVARTGDIDAVLGRHGDLFGGCTQVSRDGKHSRFSLLPDGRLPGDGVLPSVIERPGRGSPAAGIPDLGARLAGFVLEHPDPGGVKARFRALKIANAPEVRAGPSLRYVARIETADGVRLLH